MKRIVIAGATDGLGKALAEHYADQGFWVTLLGRNPNKLEKLRTELAARSKVARIESVVCDLMDQSRIPGAFADAIARSGHCDVFIYTAGVMRGGDGQTSAFEDDYPTLQVNTVAAIHLLGLFANYFRAAGRGHLVGIASIAGDRGRKGNPAYGASKAALETYLEGLRNRLAPFGVKVTTVKPGFVRTRLLEGKQGIFWAAPVDVAARTIARRVARGDEVFYVYRRWWLVAQAIKAIPRFLFKKIGPP